jgi:hypothetical protein
MAWIEQRGGQLHLGIRLGTQKLKRSLKTADPDEAREIADRVERRRTRRPCSTARRGSADIPDFGRETQ